MRSWHVYRDDTPHGPFDDDTLHALAANGQLAPTDLLTHDGGAHWQPAAQSPGLFSAPESAAQLPGMQPRTPQGSAQPMERQQGDSGHDAASPVPVVPIQAPPVTAVQVQPLQDPHGQGGDQRSTPHAMHGHAAQGQMMRGPATQQPMPGQAMYGHSVHGPAPGTAMQAQRMAAPHGHPDAKGTMQGHPGAYPAAPMYAGQPHGHGVAYGQPVASGRHGTYHPSSGHVHHTPPPGPYEEQRETDGPRKNLFVWTVVIAVFLLLVLFLYGWSQQ
jgi:hypothetical protein